MDGVNVKTGVPIKSRWGQWYRHDVVTLNGVEIGRFQVRRRYLGKRFGHRIETITCRDGGGCVMGRYLEWLTGALPRPCVPHPIPVEGLDDAYPRP